MLVDANILIGNTQAAANYMLSVCLLIAFDYSLWIFAKNPSSGNYGVQA